MSTLTTWAQSQPLLAGAAGVLLVAVVALLLRPLRKTPAAVAVASLAAMACTAYSADTSWRFAEHRLGMTSDVERAAMFAAAELALFSCALMARQNLRSPQGTPGTPGVLVWVITGVQVIPAYSESGIVGGTVRAVVGPVLAALLWHLAMGIELRHATPGAGSQSLPALLARELRERLLSRLGLAVRDRSAEQITRDRWTVKAVGLAARLAEMKPNARGRTRVARRLSVAVGKAQAGASEEQRTKLLELLAARRHAAALATIDLPSPWQDTPQDAEDTEDAPASSSVPPFPTPVPPGARLLPVVARPKAPTPTGQDAQDAPQDTEDAQDGPPPEPPLMTSADVARHYGIEQSTVRSWVAAGRIPVHGKDARGRNLFHPDDLPAHQVGVPV
ncbi:helix-turn-helix domain-containing protein [Streptomyces sp. PDY-4]|uniref:helix-turn-helix domain-containing protein n=1 Tax=Streptomyces sp. PDY-4 TaxID=3376070 RepID=UPI0037A91D83